MSNLATEQSAITSCINDLRNNITSSLPDADNNTFLPIENKSRPPLSTPVNANMVHQDEERESLTLDCQDHMDEEILFKHHWKMGSVSPNSVHLELSPRPEKSELGIQDLLQAVETLNELAAMDPEDCRDMLLEGNSKDSCAAALHQPQLSRLYQNIHRMHSIIRNSTIENDAQTADLLELHTMIQTKDERIAQLETALTKLHRRNHKLNQRSRSIRNRARRLLQQFQDFVATQHKKDNDLLVLQLQHHEQVLLRERKVSSSSEMDGVRDSLPDGDSMDSIEDSISTTTSSVYDEGIATLRISRIRTSTWPPLDAGRGGMDTIDDLASTAVLGMQDPMAPECSNSSSILNVEESDKNTQHHQPNPFAMLLGPRQVQSYTLQFLQPCELQFAALWVTGSTGERETAFAVCSYFGFDVALNVKPSLGARLLQINKEDLNSNWTVQDLAQHIRDLGPRVSMTFRNDNWSKDQNEALQLAIHEQERLHGVSGPEGSAHSFGNLFARQRTRSEPFHLPPSLRGSNVRNFLKLPGKKDKIVDQGEPEKPNSLQVCNRGYSEATTKSSGSKTKTENEDGKGLSSSMHEIAHPSTSENLSSYDKDDATARDANISGVANEECGATSDCPLPNSPKEHHIDAGEMIMSSMKNMGKLFQFGNK